MLLQDLVAASARVRSTASRRAKIDALAECLRDARGAEISVTVNFLSGQTRQRRHGIGWAALRALPPPAPTSSLHVLDVDRALSVAEKLLGPGSSGRRRELTDALMRRATHVEQQFIVRLLGGELRQGAQAGLMLDAIAAASGAPADVVRRAAMLSGDAGRVAEAALTVGVDALEQITMEVGKAVLPMLAQSAPSVPEAMSLIGSAVVDWKLDGVRVQVHRRGDEVRVFTRSLDDVTGRMPEVAAAARALPVDSAVLDGEALVLRADGRPQPFQETASRSGTRMPDPGGAALTPLFFDLLHLDGISLIDLPLVERDLAMRRLLPPEMIVPRLMTADVERADAFFSAALERGHEGVVIKRASSSYLAGRRGGDWIKVKPRVTLDLVILAAEWGHGRRQGWLSNLHLGARGGDDSFVMLGKTFKGLTDEMLRWQTDALLKLETRRDRATVFVRPELVVEVAFDGVQRSPRYPGGVALRFARVLRHRPDKAASEADTLETVLRLHAGGVSPL
jgi:DNA ligase-1